MHKAKDNPILVHPEEDWKLKIPLGGDHKRNLCATALEEHGDVDKVLGECKYTVEHTYHTRANQQTMMETFRTACYMDHFGRLIVLSSTQIPFHVRRIVGRALDIPASKVRVIKPRIGGGFGAKQSSISEVYPAFVTWMTKKPSKIIFSREESQIASSPRHEIAGNSSCRSKQEWKDPCDRCLYIIQYRSLWRTWSNNGRVIWA